jgi:hypothetical protein
MKNVSSLSPANVLTAGAPCLREGNEPSRQFYRPVIVAMTIMRVVQPSVHEVIEVIAVGHAFVSTARSMRVRAPGVGGAARGIGVADLDDMFVNVIPMHMMHVTIVEVIDMAVMAHSCVSATRTMPMRVIRMMLLVAGRHGFARLSGELVWWA